MNQSSKPSAAANLANDLAVVQVLRGEALARGHARAPVALLREPLSFWGGYDSVRGEIVERAHPYFGQSLAGTVMVMPRAKGSSSSSSVLAEAIRNRTGPFGIVMRERDLIIAIGVIVASDLYGIHVPLVVLGEADFEAIREPGQLVQIDAPDDTGEACVTLLKPR